MFAGCMSRVGLTHRNGISQCKCANSFFASVQMCEQYCTHACLHVCVCYDVVMVVVVVVVVVMVVCE